MNRTRLKQALFVGLLLACAYVWYGNVDQYYDSGTGYYEEFVLAATETHRLGVKPRLLTVRSPQLNPFQQGLAQPIVPRLETRPQPAPPTPPAPDLLSRHCTLIGILSETGSSQAVVRFADGDAIVLGVGDSLAGWRLAQIVNQQVEFRQDTYYDTLRLAPTIQ
jgi:hypothetical protein